MSVTGPPGILQIAGEALPNFAVLSSVFQVSALIPSNKLVCQKKRSGARIDREHAVLKSCHHIKVPDTGKTCVNHT